MSVPIYTVTWQEGGGGERDWFCEKKACHVPCYQTISIQSLVGYHTSLKSWSQIVILLLFGFRWGKVTVSQEVLQDLLPGPVTLVFERTDQLNPELNPTTRLVGIRIPDHYFVQQLSLRCEEPLALTSANVSTVGQSSLKIEVSWLYGVDLRLFVIIVLFICKK